MRLSHAGDALGPVELGAEDGETEEDDQPARSGKRDEQQAEDREPAADDPDHSAVGHVEPRMRRYPRAHASQHPPDRSIGPLGVGDLGADGALEQEIGNLRAATRMSCRRTLTRYIANWL